ncbi:imidazole glycerol phosphate synthase subunit HisF [Altererythrobacter confluentis]|uniref:Imidazole glycerol phosphate synthase subunit HisF n=1 Tax=Allopontixanthobacter confluentis TaxID=1849021 RepID=A0A6L7GGG6_9SPHN|nr:AglZ/HisF2 family acetamidino modification protein [Allopontixanthobacter confluentis]MXP15153.1 imidazole glycerol phosphate synthase subunit HisF [Allopontixanthobacter confluentis]
MLRTRIIPALLLDNESLVKTRQFRKPGYVGDPCNTLRIFNELEVDEIAFLDITATRQGREPNFALLKDIATECFMPLAYGGGITSLDQAARIYGTGFEKVILNSYPHERPEIISEIAEVYGSQAVVASIDVGKSLFGRPTLMTHGGRKRQRPDPVSWAVEMQRRGAGEILLTSIEREGTWSGQDIALVKEVSEAVNIPVIAQGGTRSIGDMVETVKQGGASSVAVGSMVVYQKKDFGVLVNFPERSALEEAFLA